MQQLIEMLLGQQNQSNVTDIMQQFGLDEQQAQKAIGSLLPAISQGIGQQAQNQNTDIIAQIAQAKQQQYLDDDNARLYDEPAVQEGNAILAQILGSKDNSRALASDAAQQTGLDSQVLKKILPMVASMAMGALGKQAGQQGMQQNLQQNPNSVMDLVGSLLGGTQQQQGNQGANNNGFGLDDVMNLASKFLRK
ncbi:DUF937 domain-containing protein [Ostreibacterium oceani]|uniref:DUF937 domain-containing protein n=1 Tax=Ostreibacterium oceani TaxID=2654998 RepID=A0A6N7EVP2_9GAMM|nr:DUF937 domain-containing protein [Ostreibacterium oceani]MPV86621.1 DUF937 domain-containing protein [Ostreibacterium oceani]